MRRPVHQFPEALPTFPGLSFYLCLPGTAKCTTYSLGLSWLVPAPETDADPTGLPAKAQVSVEKGQFSPGVPGDGGGKSKSPQVIPRYPWASVPPSGQ